MPLISNSYDSAIATNGTLDDAFWVAMDFTRRTARQAIDQGYAYNANGTMLQMDALLIPSQNAGVGLLVFSCARRSETAADLGFNVFAGGRQPLRINACVRWLPCHVCPHWCA